MNPHATQRATLLAHLASAARLACVALVLVMSVMTAAAAEESPRISVREACRTLGMTCTAGKDRHVTLLSRGARRGEVKANTRNLMVDGVLIVLGDAVDERKGELWLSRIDYERRFLPIWRPDLVPHLPKAPRVIVLDPGHGGWAAGAENKSLKVQEKVITLDVALRLKPLLEAKGWTVVLTRERDEALAKSLEDDLDRRAALANQAGADVFVSIHFDAAANGALFGSEVFSYAPAHQWATDSWNNRAKLNALSRSGPSGISDQEVPANRYDAANTLLAHAVYSRLVPALKTADLGERIAHFRVLANLNCPGILVEPAYLSNPMEALRVYSPDFRQQVAAALAAGLEAYAAEIRDLQPAGR